MMQYNRLHYVICETGKQPEELDSFKRYLEKKLHSLYGIVDNEDVTPLSCLRCIEKNKEMLYVVFDDAFSKPFRFHFDVYWCVASLKYVRQFIDDIKVKALKASLQFVNYPDEMAKPFHQSVSPFFYWYDVPFVCKEEYLLRLIESEFTIVNEMNKRFVGFTEEEMHDFAQLDKQDRVIRQIRSNHLFGDRCMKCILVEMMEVAEYVESLLNSL